MRGKRETSTSRLEVRDRDQCWHVRAERETSICRLEVRETSVGRIEDGDTSVSRIEIPVLAGSRQWRPA